jgi:hypothetical protein
MKQLRALVGSDIRNVIQEALKQTPCWFDFNGVHIEVVDSMKGHPNAANFLYQYYNAGLSRKPLPVWSVKAPEKPCKQCGKNNFVTDKKCWWCETSNPCV